MEASKALVSVMTSFGYKKAQRACWENDSVSSAKLADLKKEIDRVTDYYDTVRMYQFPVEGAFVVTELRQKKWKRLAMKAGEGSQKMAGAAEDIV